MKQIASLEKEKLVYIDESGIDEFVSREYGWGKRGSIVSGNISGKRYARESFIAGIVGQNIVAPFRYKGTCNTLLFNHWLEGFLLPELGPGHTIILDNATFHKSAITSEIVSKAQCQLIFLPPYSPDLNPIERLWARIKGKIRKIISKFSSLSDAIDYAFMSIT